MALRYRSVLTTTNPDPANRVSDWLADRVGNASEIGGATGDGILGFVAKLDRRSEIRVVVVPRESESTVVVVEERHPASLGDVQSGTTPGYIESFLQSADYFLGGLPVRDVASVGDITRWLNGSEDGQVVAVIGDTGDRRIARVLSEVKRHVLGMAVVGLLPVADAEQLLWDADSSSKPNPGAIVYVARREGSTDVHVTPAMLAIRQPEAAARRQQQWWCLPWQAKVSLGEGIDSRVVQLWEHGVPVAGTEEEWLNALDQREQENLRLQQDLQYAWLEQDEAQRELQRVRRELAYAQRRLTELESAPIYEQPDEVDDVEPETCEECVEFGRDYLGRLLICDTSGVKELDQHEKSGVWAGKIWAALRAMDSFAQYRNEHEYAGNFLSFCDDPPLGAIGFVATSVAMNAHSDDSDHLFRRTDH